MYRPALISAASPALPVSSALLACVASLALLVCCPALAAAADALNSPPWPTADPAIKAPAELQAARLPGEPAAGCAPRSDLPLRESGNLLEETVGDWQWNYQTNPACRGNIYHVDTTVNLHEHRLRMYTPQPMTLIFVVYRGAAVTGQYTMIDQVTVNVPAGDQFYSSGPRDILLEAGGHYFIGAAFSRTVIWGRRNDLPPQSVSFGQVETSVPGGTGFTYPPQPTATNTYSGFQPMHQIVVTGTPPVAAAPGAASAFAVTAPYGSLSAQLEWVNPALTASGDPLTQLTGVKVYRDDTLLADLTGVQIGQPSAYVDASAPVAGYYAYEVVPYNAAGNGETTRRFEWVGHGTGVYDWVEIAYDWFDIMAIGTNTGITEDDELAGPFPLGFTFPFWAGLERDSYDAVYVCSNGYLAFTPGDPMFMNFHIPLPGEPNNIVAPYWDDFNPSAYGQVYYFNDAAHGRFIVQWNDLPSWGPPEGHHTLQAVLYPDGTIDFLYKELTPGVPGSATVGVENADGTEALEICYNGFGGFRPRVETALRLFHPDAAHVTAETVRPQRCWLRGPTVATPSGRLALRLWAADPGRVRLTLVDSGGRAQGTLYEGHLPRGERTLSLEWSAAGGQRLGAGVYYVVADGALRASQRIIVLQ